LAEVGYSTVVTTKLDVYSYGVHLLELLTGKQPADDPSFGESLHVAAWVKEKVRQNEGKMSESVLDPSLLDVTNLAAKDEMLSVQTIALLCTRDKPVDRPAMKQVVEMLSSLSHRNKNGHENGIQNV
jgi:serine/threonine protein kinase